MIKSLWDRNTGGGAYSSGITLLKIIKSLWDRNMGGWAYSSGQNPLSKMSKACVTEAMGGGGGVEAYT